MAGCAAPSDGGVTGTPDATTMATTSAAPPPDTAVEADAAALLEQALAARAAEDPQRFAALVAQAAASCTDPAAARRLGELSAIAGRWADSLAFARPKVQARTESQLAEVEWDALISACTAP
jgi:hypothetical protein